MIRPILCMIILCTTMYGDNFSYISPSILTAYCPCVDCCGDFDGKVRGQTASGSMAKQGRTLAGPKFLPFGTSVVLDGKVLGFIEDRGGAIGVTKNGYLRLDVYFDTHAEALEFGIQKREVTITIKETE